MLVFAWFAIERTATTIAPERTPGDLWEAVVLVVFYITGGFSTPLIPAACSQDLPPFLAVLSTHCCNAWSLA